MATILIVEDNEMNRDMLGRRLARRGFDIETAVDGLEGLDMVQKGALDLILMDLSLPNLDGWEATRRLKADPATWEIPIIVLTAHALEHERQKALATGCDDFDVKPIDFARLMSKIERFVGSRETASEKGEFRVGRTSPDLDDPEYLQDAPDE